MADSYSFQIERFKTAFEKGGARPNLFRVMVPGGQGAGNPLGHAPTGFGLNQATKFTFSCRAASIPGMTVGVIELPYFGRKVRLPGDRTFAEWTVTVINDEDWSVRRAFERWNNGINTMESNIRTTREQQQLGKYDLAVFQFDKSGTSPEVARYKLIGAFPSDISPIELAWDTNDTIEEFTVTFQYDYFISDTGTSGGLSPIS